MPRQGITKTYARPNRGGASLNNKTFDEIMADKKPSTAQASATINRWGKTSFTSKRNVPVTEDVVRKRKASEDSDEDAGFGDPFSFDSDDDGPSKPKRGMGYKVSAKSAKTQEKSVFDRIMESGTNAATNATNNGKAERDAPSSSISSKPSARTYGSGGGKTSTTKSAPLLKSPPDSKKQLSMDSFTTKFSSKSLLSFGSSSKASGSSSNSSKPKEQKNSRSGWSSDEDNDDDADADSEFTSIVAAPPRRLLTARAPREPLRQPPPKQPMLRQPMLLKQRTQNQQQGKAAGKDEEPKETADQLFDRAIAEGHIPVVKPGEEEEETRETLTSDDNDNNLEDSSSLCSTNSPQSSIASGPAARTYGARKKSPVKPGSADNKKGKLGKKSGSWSLGGNKKLASLEDQPKKKQYEGPVIRRLLTSPKKRDVSIKGKAKYNARNWHDSDEEEPASSQEKTVVSSKAFDGDFDDEPAPVSSLPVMRRASTWPAHAEESVSKLHVTKEHKPLFTVVRNVKQAHEVQEHGESVEFQDDVEYIMEGLDNNKISIRCLSTLSLATKCTMPAFRMHLRAHGLLTKIFSALHDAAKYPNLALCTAAVMYMMSRDRIGMDLEKSSLELMLSLLSVDSQFEHLANDRNDEREYERLKMQLQGICDKLDKEGNVNHFVLEEVSTGHMATETLLSLTSKKTGEWFKEELRTLGGLDHIINTVVDCVGDLEDIMMEPSDEQLDCFRKAERCLRVLENVTYLNSDNQHHLTTYKSSALISAAFRVMKVCEDSLPFNEVEEGADKKVDKQSAGYIVFNALLAVLRILLNLTHDHELGSAKIGQKEGLIRCALNCILRVPKYVTTEQRFDLLVLGLGLLINMVEHCDGNRIAVLKSKTGKPFELYNPLNNLIDTLDALTLLFNLRYKAARQIEEEHDRELEEREKKKAEEKGHAEAAVAKNNESGEWRESESGLEWVMVPLEERGEEQITTTRGKDGAITAKTLGLSLDSDDDVDIVPSAQDENDEKFTEALHKAGRHMEDNIVGAYVALLLGCLVKDSRELGIRVRDHLPDDSFEPMVRMLKKFLGFMNFTSATGDRKSIMKVIETFENFDNEFI